MNKIVVTLAQLAGKVDSIHNTVTTVYNAWLAIYSVIQQLRKPAVPVEAPPPPPPPAAGGSAEASSGAALAPAA